MIDEATKNKLLQELEKSGNVYLSCLKVGVNKATYYRWLKEDNAFSKKAYQAIRFGRENNCDVAEHSIMLLVKEKNLKASEYILSHNSPRYKPSMSSSKVFLEHKRAITTEKEKSKPRNWEEVMENTVPEYKAKALERLNNSDKELIRKANAKIANGEHYQVTLEDIMTYEEKKLQENLAQIEEIKERYEKLGGVPPKPDGSKITDEELPEYDGYIEEWYIKKGKIMKTENTTIDFISFSGKDKPTDTEDLVSETDKQQVKPQENQTPSNNLNSGSAMQNKPQDNNI